MGQGKDGAAKRFLFSSFGHARFAGLPRCWPPVAASIVVNLLLVGALAEATTSAHRPQAIAAPAPAAISVTLVNAEMPMLTGPASPRAHATLGNADGLPTVAPRRRKQAGSPAPVERDTTVAAGSGADASVAIGPPPGPAQPPAGLRGLLEEDGCGPRSDQLHGDCKQRFARIKPPEDPWQSTDFAAFEARFGHVEGVEEHIRNSKALLARLHARAGHLDPAFGD